MDGGSKRMALSAAFPWCCTRMMRHRSVSRQAADPAAVAVFEDVVVFVTSWDVRRDVDGRDLPRLDKTLRHHDREQLGDERRGDRGHGADADRRRRRSSWYRRTGRGCRCTTSATSDNRFPLGCFGVTALVCSRLVTAIDGCGRAALAAQRHLDDRAVDPGVGGDDEDVGGPMQGEPVEQLGDHRRVALQRRAGAAPLGRGRRAARRRGRAMRLVGISPPARPAISMANASEWPVPNACTTPPALNASTISLQAESRGLALAPSASRSRRLTTSPR